MGELLSEFGIDAKTLIAQLINFGLFLFIFKRFIYGPVSKVLKERQAIIENTVRKNELIEQKLAEIEAHRTQEFAQVKDEVARIIEEAKKRGDEVTKGIVRESEERAKEVMSAAHEKMKIEKESLRAELKEEFEELFIVALEKVLKKEYGASQKTAVLTQITEVLSHKKS